MLQDYIKDPGKKQIVEFFLKQHEFGRPYAMPPGSPKDAVKIMAKAIQELSAKVAALEAAAAQA